MSVIWSILARLNLASVWKRRVNVWGGRFAAITADRLLYLYLHRWNRMGVADRRLLEQQVRPGMTVVDIGANLGLYSSLLSRLAGPSGKLFAFEPDPELFEALQQNCAENGCHNTQLFNVALGSRKTETVLNRSLFNAGDNRLADGQSISTVKKVSAQMVTLDEILGDQPVDFIKIDVQGWELEVFRGMQSVFRASPQLRIYLEYWPAGLQKAGADPVSFLEYLSSLGFSFHLPRGRELIRVKDYQTLQHSVGRAGYMNLLAVRE